MSELESLIKKFIDNEVNKLWIDYRERWEEAPKPLQNFLERIPELFKDIELDNDLRDKREVYLEIAKFLHKKFNQPVPICLGVTHLLCRESDKRLLRDGVPGEKKLIEASKSILITIKVSYEPLDSQVYNRQVEIYYMSNNKPAVFKVEQQLDWDYLPQDIRSRRLRQGAAPEVYKLYPPQER